MVSIRLLITGLLLAVCGGCATPPQGAAAAQPPRPGEPLAPFYRALAALQHRHSGSVAVLQIGDSHTANDAFSGRLRELMQARFGDAGRGMLPPGIPYRYYRPAQVSVTAEGWTVAPSSGNAPAPPPFGLAGVRQTASGPASMTIATDPGGLDRLMVEALAQPGGGTLTITTSDGRTMASPTDAPGQEVMFIRAPENAISAAGLPASVTVSTAGDGPVDLLSWTAGRAAPGVTWSNLGTVGATVDLVLQWNPAIMAAEAAQLQPALILLAFGTNEGFRDSTDLALYQTQVRAVLQALRRAAPDAAIAVAGPPGGVRPIGAGRGAPCPGGRYAVPINLPRVRAILHQQAVAAGLFYWDWSAAMGGDCAMIDWAERDPPWGAHDHVHLLQPGARATAEALFATLMADYPGDGS